MVCIIKSASWTNLYTYGANPRVVTVTPNYKVKNRAFGTESAILKWWTYMDQSEHSGTVLNFWIVHCIKMHCITMLAKKKYIHFDIIYSNNVILWRNLFKQSLSSHGTSNRFQSIWLQIGQLQLFIYLKQNWYIYIIM